MSSTSLNPLTFVFQDFALLPWRTVAGNIVRAARTHTTRQREIEAAVADVLAHRASPISRPPCRNNCRVACVSGSVLPAVLAVRPAILLMDEALSALDKARRAISDGGSRAIVEQGNMSVLA